MRKRLLKGATSDEEDLAFALERLLKREGHSVDKASGFQEALRLSAARLYDAVLLDLGLPDGDGFDLLAEAWEPALAVPDPWSLLEGRLPRPRSATMSLPAFFASVAVAYELTLIFINVALAANAGVSAYYVVVLLLICFLPALSAVMYGSR